MKNKKNNENKDLTEQLQRLQAEFENYKKRTEKEQEQLKDHTKAQLLLKLLNIHDDFERTLATQATQEQLQTGVQLIYRQLQKLLTEEQVMPIESKGQKLDPYKHEVLAQEKGKEDIITEELQKGYMHKDKILRPAKVKISKTEE